VTDHDPEMDAIAAELEKAVLDALLDGQRA
jgi:hypothetical protein